MVWINKPSGEEIPIETRGNIKGTYEPTNARNTVDQKNPTISSLGEVKVTTPTDEHYYQVQELGRTFSD